METILFIDADSALGRVLCDELSNAGYRVIAHVRSEPRTSFAPGVTVASRPRAADALAGWNETLGPISHVVFGQPDYSDVLDADADFERFTASIEERLNMFLEELQAAGALLARNSGGGQIWALTPEDSMQYYVGCPSVPIDTRARQAAVKSFAKELFRFGVRINCANVQLLEEQVSPDEWRRARDGLKTYAMRFKPNKTAAVARLLRQFLTQRDLPLAGMIVPIGIGFAENNI